MPKTKILIVEQDPVTARDLREMLRNMGMGYSVTAVARSGEEALARIEEDRPHLILMNITLPGKLDGIKTARRIRARRDIPIIYITTHSDKKTLQKAKITEPFGYLLKPIHEEDLRIAIEIALHTHARVKKIEKALQESETRFQQLLHHMNEAVIVLDEKGIVTYVNDKFLEKSGYTKKEVLGRPPVDFFSPEYVENYKKQFARRKKGLADSYEIEVKNKEGRKALLQVSSAPLHNHEGRFKGSISILSDITESRRFEEEIHRSHRELRRLSRHLQSLREKESKRIAREIHDQLGQALTALKMDINWLSSKLPDAPKELKRLQAKMKNMSTTVDKTIQMMQRIASELRPGILDDLGLVPAIEWLAQDFQKRTSIKCKPNLDPIPEALDPECSTAIFRVVQEALTNAARHSRATRVRVNMKKRRDKLALKIADNGRGILEKDILSPDSLGLIGMRERLRPFHGEISIKGIPDKGTTLTINLPIESIRKRYP
jgi:two-component system sensor histidine kinase UhpB